MNRNGANGHTELPASVACYDTTCGHHVGGRLEVCTRSELAATRKPKLGDMAEGAAPVCVHLLRKELAQRGAGE